MSECNHNCSDCNAEGCESREIVKLKQNEMSNIKKIFAVISGKGGVGKSLVTSLLANSLNQKGNNVAIIDADVTGPSIPQAFGLNGKIAKSDEQYLYPVLSGKGIKIMSANVLMQDPEAPIIWRGPLVAGFVGQLFTDVAYGDVDYLLIDMPPGTGDIPLTVFQQIPIDGIIVVTSPQELVSMVVAKSINMAKMMNIPILGVVENMAYVKCPKCDEKIRIFGDENSKQKIESQGLKVIGELPIDPKLAKLVDQGKIEDYSTYLLDEVCNVVCSK